MDPEAPLHCPITEVTDIESEALTELQPLIQHLQANQPVQQPTTFPRGTVLADGRLDLCKQNLGPNGCRLITDALTANTNITSILLGTDAIGDAGAADVARLIERNTHMEVLYLGCNQIQEAGTAALAQALTHNDNVLGLWLKRNPLGLPGARALAEMLRHNRRLRTLDLVNTQIGIDGLAAILDVLIHPNRTIERVYLGGNQIDAAGAQLLATLLKENSSIKALLLNVNHLGDTGAQVLADALQQNRTLVELGLASNGIAGDGGIALMRAIQEHPCLARVDLGYSASTRVLGAQANALGDAGAQATGEMLIYNHVLRWLDLRRNNIGEMGTRALIAGLEHNTTLLKLHLDGKQNARIVELLERNQTLHPQSAPGIDRDVALTRSVYRTAAKPIHHNDR